MARLPRLTDPGYPHHVIQRGNNRQLIFVDDADRERFLQVLRDYAKQYQVAVHAYVLMSNHVHLLLTPQTAQGVPQLMQALGRSYVRTFNQRHGRTGTLWEGRYRSALVEADRYLLACMAYIDLNPVRAGMVARAGDFPWSSHAHYLGRRVDALVTPHPLIWQLGNTPFAREAAYAELVHAGISIEQHRHLGRAAHSGWALGEAGFLSQVEGDTARRLTPAPRGRPRKSAILSEEK